MAKVAINSYLKCAKQSYGSLNYLINQINPLIPLTNRMDPPPPPPRATTLVLCARLCFCLCDCLLHCPWSRPFLFGCGGTALRIQLVIMPLKYCEMEAYDH